MKKFLCKREKSFLWNFLTQNFLYVNQDETSKKNEQEKSFIDKLFHSRLIYAHNFKACVP